MAGLAGGEIPQAGGRAGARHHQPQCPAEGAANPAARTGGHSRPPLHRRSLGGLGDKSQDIATLVGHARVALARQIVQNIVGSELAIPCITLEPSLNTCCFSPISKHKSWRRCKLLYRTAPGRATEQLPRQGRAKQSPRQAAGATGGRAHTRHAGGFVRYNLPDMQGAGLQRSPRQQTNHHRGDRRCGSQTAVERWR